MECFKQRLKSKPWDWSPIYACLQRSLEQMQHSCPQPGRSLSNEDRRLRIELAQNLFTEIHFLSCSPSA